MPRLNPSVSYGGFGQRRSERGARLHRFAQERAGGQAHLAGDLVARVAEDAQDRARTQLLHRCFKRLCPLQAGRALVSVPLPWQVGLYASLMAAVVLGLGVLWGPLDEASRTRGVNGFFPKPIPVATAQGRALVRRWRPSA